MRWSSWSHFSAFDLGLWAVVHTWANFLLPHDLSGVPCVDLQDVVSPSLRVQGPWKGLSVLHSASYRVQVAGHYRLQTLFRSLVKWKNPSWKLSFLKLYLLGIARIRLVTSYAGACNSKERPRPLYVLQQNRQSSPSEHLPDPHLESKPQSIQLLREGNISRPCKYADQRLTTEALIFHLQYVGKSELTCQWIQRIISVWKSVFRLRVRWKLRTQKNDNTQGPKEHRSKQ